jgi:hypothetical protein
VSLLALTNYAPGPGATTYTLTSTPTSLDPTHLTVPFTTSASGLGSTQVIVRLSALQVVVSSGAHVLWGLFDHTTAATVGSASEVMFSETAEANYTSLPIVVSSLSPSTAYQYDFAAYADAITCTIVVGVNHAWTTANAGPAVMEVWAA